MLTIFLLSSVIIYLAGSSYALLLMVYRRYLRFMPVARGYALAGMLVVLLGVFDVVAFSFTEMHIKKLTTTEQNTGNVTFTAR